MGGGRGGNKTEKKELGVFFRDWPSNFCAQEILACVAITLVALDLFLSILLQIEAGSKFETFIG